MALCIHALIVVNFAHDFFIVRVASLTNMVPPRSAHAEAPVLFLAMRPAFPTRPASSSQPLVFGWVRGLYCRALVHAGDRTARALQSGPLRGHGGADQFRVLW
jgi:hypothetical protein